MDVKLAIITIITVVLAYQTKAKEDLYGEFAEFQKEHLVAIDSLNKVSAKLDTMTASLEFDRRMLKAIVEDDKKQIEELKRNEPKIIGGNREETSSFFSNYFKRNRTDR